MPSSRPRRACVIPMLRNKTKPNTPCACAKPARGIIRTSKVYTNTRTRRRRPNNGRHLVDIFTERGARPFSTISIAGAMPEGPPATFDVQSSPVYLRPSVVDHENRHFCTVCSSTGSSSCDEGWGRRRGCGGAPADHTRIDGRRRPTQHERSPLRASVGSVKSDSQSELPVASRGIGAFRHLESKPGVYRLPQQLLPQARVHSADESVWRSGEKEMRSGGERESS